MRQDMSIESQLVDSLAEKWESEGKLVAKELHIPIASDIYYDNYLEGREYIRIDLAAYDKKTDKIIFVEAENGLYLQHPQIYLPFCHKLYILCPEERSSYRGEQLEWSMKQGIGVIEQISLGALIETLAPKTRKIVPAVHDYVKSRFFKRLEKEKKTNVIITK
jgi:hypothetical protein